MNMFKNPPVIHIGYPKAASTTLQKQLFNKHPEIHNLGLYPTGNIGRDSKEVDYNCAYLEDEKLRQFYYNLVMLEGIEYLNSGNIKLYKEFIAPYLDGDRCKLFSNERFTSVFFSHPDRKEKADRLKSIFPNAKIIVIIRNQLDIIKSQYRDHPFDPRCLRKGKPVSLEDWIKISLEDDLAIFLRSLKYHELVNYYCSLFGKENVGVFLFENMVNDLDHFAGRLSNFVNINGEITKKLLSNKHENKSVSQRFNTCRVIQRYFPFSLDFYNQLPESTKKKIMKFIEKGNKKEYSIDTDLKSELTDYFRESNIKLQKEYDLNIAFYDYPM